MAIPYPKEEEWIQMFKKKNCYDYIKHEIYFAAIEAIVEQTGKSAVQKVKNIRYVLDKHHEKCREVNKALKLGIYKEDSLFMKIIKKIEKKMNDI